MTFIAALSRDGITVPWVIDGPRCAKGAIVILDNLGRRKAPTIRTAIRACHAQLGSYPAAMK